MPLSVLLIAPGSIYPSELNFGDPHLVGLGSDLQATLGARVEVVDLDYERLLPRPEPERIFDSRHAVIGLSCYSSYDYLKTFYLAVEIRRRHPGAIIVAGGYHPSARPGDFLHLPDSPLDEPSPFDHVIIGEGELPLRRLVGAAARGERLAQPVLGPEPVADLDALPPLNWTLLDRYRAIARTISDQATLHLSRGCPFQCSFCMEHAKGLTPWRAWSPARAEREVLALQDWLGQRGWKLFIADALFGLQPEWQREMLDRFARLKPGWEKVWTLTRVDLVQDLERFHRAGFGLGFGLESGAPAILRLTGKTNAPEAFHDRFLALAQEATALQFPWGANIIMGHPGETEATLEHSARFVEKLFLGHRGLTGFLSVDPFRFYPGSPIDRRLEWFQSEFGTRVHRPRWWNYSEPAFCSEWVDPSAALDYHRKAELAARLFDPIIHGIARNFDYRGPAREYFRRSVDSAMAQTKPEARLAMLADYHLWQRLTGQGPGDLTADGLAQILFRQARQQTVGEMEQRFSALPVRHRQALVEAPRERFVPPDMVLASWQDQTVALTEDGLSNVSALHAYAVNFRLLDLQAGDRFLDLGAGTGYGTAVAARLVGPAGHVTAIEVLPELAAQARNNLRDYPNVSVCQGDALALETTPGFPFNKVLFSFCLETQPRAFLDALPEGGRLLAPLLKSRQTGQVLTLFTRQGGEIRVSEHGEVLYGDPRTS